VSKINRGIGRLAKAKKIIEIQWGREECKHNFQTNKKRKTVKQNSLKHIFLLQRLALLLEKRNENTVI
jgi:hypothetical protein